MFGARLKQLREQRGLSQKQLADVAGLSQRAVSHWEQGLRQPTWDAVQALCDALGVDCEAFREERSDTETIQSPRPRGRPRKEPTPKPPAPEPTKRSGSKKGKRRKG